MNATESKIEDKKVINKSVTTVNWQQEHTYHFIEDFSDHLKMNDHWTFYEFHN